MFTLLQIEWLKIKKYKPMWVIFGFLLLLLPSVTIGFGQLFGNFTEGNQALTTVLGNPLDFNTVFYTAAYLNNGLNIAWGALLILMIGNEFQSKTMRQNVIDGQHRNEIIHSKLLLVLIFSLVSSLLVILSGLIAGIMFSKSTFYFDVVLLKIFGISFFAAIMQMLFALLFAFLIKRPALSVILYLIYTVFIENVLVSIIVYGFKFKYGQLLLTQAPDELTINPLTKNMKAETSIFIEQDAVWIACVIYAAAILFFLYRYINKTQLK